MKIERTEEERDLIARAERLFPTGTRAFTFDPELNFVVGGAEGSRIQDASGNEYVDYLLGSGPHILGHRPRAVLEALAEAPSIGTSHLVVSERAIRLAEKIVEHVPCAEMVTFHSSGSEATFFALRIARAYRKREKVLKFEGAYHGMHDYALQSNQWTMGSSPYPRSVPNSHGIPAAVGETVLVAPYNDLDTTARILREHRDELAAVIMEPLQRTFPPEGVFLQGVRELTANYDVPLIFDEVVTGFRLGLGGAQAHYGVTPDLCALGKAISGGLPLGVLAGRADLMAIANPKRRLQMLPFTMQTGTFSSNAVCTSVALAIIEELEKGEAHARIEKSGSRLMEGLRAAMARAGVEAHVTGHPSVFEIWFQRERPFDHRSSKAADKLRAFRFADLLLRQGVLKAAEKFFVSAAHDDDDVETTLAAFEVVAEQLSEARS